VLGMGSEAAGVLAAIPAGLLLVAGGGKLIAGSPGSDAADSALPSWAVRPLGLAETVLAGACLARPSAILLAGAALLFAAFALYTGARVARGERGGCGCLWGDERLDPVHVAVDACLAVMLAAAAVNPPGSLLPQLWERPPVGAALALSVAACVGCLVLVLRHLTDAMTAYRPQRAGSR
jgi:hypothetical protein